MTEMTTLENSMMNNQLIQPMKDDAKIDSSITIEATQEISDGHLTVLGGINVAKYGI